MDYVKVVLGDASPSVEAFRAELEKLAHPGVDVRLLQVGAHEAVLPRHLALHLCARTGQNYRELLVAAGAKDATLISERDYQTLVEQRVEDDLQTRVSLPVPDAAGGKAWHLQCVRAPVAWAEFGGPDAIPWSGVKVGQVDTGYTEHVAFGFGGAPGAPWIDTAMSRTILFPDVPPELDPFPAPLPDTLGRDPMNMAALNKGHGTRVGATISGCCTTTAGERFYGVAPRVPHVHVRITDSVGINRRQEEFAAALRYLVDEAGADVVNVSLGIYPPKASPAVKNAMRHARSRGVIVVCAAGNYVASVVAPATLDTAIAVGGITWKEEPWAHSAYGPEVAFSAPAAEIHRPIPIPAGIGHDFAEGGDGTSYATAITTGAAALWLLKWAPEIEARYGKTAARVEAFKAAAIATARQPECWMPQPFGAGVIDVGALCTEAGKALP